MHDTYLSISNFLNKQAVCKARTSILLAVIKRHIAGKPANKISTSSLNHNNPKLSFQMVFDGRRIDRVTAGSPVIDELCNMSRNSYTSAATIENIWLYIMLFCYLFGYATETWYSTPLTRGPPKEAIRYGKVKL